MSDSGSDAPADPVTTGSHPPAGFLRMALHHLGSRTIAVILAILAIGISGALFFLMIAITEGQEVYLRGKMIEVSPHIVLTPERISPGAPRILIDGEEEFVELAVNRPPLERRELKPYLATIERIEGSSPLVSAVAPFVGLEVVLRNGVRSRTATVRGIDPAREKGVAGIAAAMQWGGFDRLTTARNGAIIGRGIADHLGVTLGDGLQLVTATGRLERVEVAGVFSSGVDDLDDRRAYITLDLAHSLKDMSRIAATGMSIQVKSMPRASEARQRIETATGYRAETWDDINRSAIAFHRRHSFAFQLLVALLLGVAASGAVNALQGVTLARREELMTLATESSKRSATTRLLLVEGLLIGLAAGVLASVGGYLLIQFAGDRLASVGLYPENNPLVGFHLERFRVRVNPLLMAGTFVLAILVGVAAGMIAALRLRLVISAGVAGSATGSSDVDRSFPEPSGGSIWNRAVDALRRRRLQSISIAGAIAVATAMMIISLSLFGGLNDTFTARVLDVAPHVVMTPAAAERIHDEPLVSATDGSVGAVELVRRAGRQERPRIRNGIAILRGIERTMGEDIRAASPYLSTQALAGSGTNEATLELHGVYPEREEIISDLKGSMTSGSVDRLQSNRSGVLLGARAAAELRASLGSRLRLVSMTGERYNAQVVGIYTTGVDMVDRRGVINLRLAQSLANALPGEITGVGMQLRNPGLATAVAAKVERQSGRITDTWEQTFESTLANFRYLRNLFFIISLLMIVVCALALANIMMRVSGAPPVVPADAEGVTDRARRRSLHLAQALLVASTGALAGVLLGVIGVQLLSLLPGLSPDSGVVSFQTDRLPLVLKGGHILIAFFAALVISMCAVLPPVIRGVVTTAGTDRSPGGAIGS